MAYDQDLADRVLAAIGTRPGIAEKRRFGGLCILLNGNMLCGVESDRFMFRVGKERQDEALAKPGASPMDFTGRPLGGYVYVDAAVCDDGTLAEWIDFSIAYVDTLPIKKPKAGK